MLSRLIFGARTSLFIGLSVMIISAVTGVALGLIAAFAGGIADVMILRVMDLIMAIPSLVLAILIVAVLGPSLMNTIIAVTAIYLPRYVRLVRASALTELRKDYVTAAQVAGAGPFRIMLSTVLPNCLAPLIVQAALGVSDFTSENRRTRRRHRPTKLRARLCCGSSRKAISRRSTIPTQKAR